MPAAKAPTGSLAGRVVVLDPGHNGQNWKIPSDHLVYAGNGITKLCNTTGTSTTGGYPEHAFTWDVALRAKALLEARGAKVILTRPSDDGIGPCFDKRAAIGNAAHADAEVAIHADGGPASGHGFHVMRPPAGNPAINPGASLQSRALAVAMHDAFHASTGIPYSTYIKGGYLTTTNTGGINLSTRPDITIECLNMRNPGDAAMATSAAWRQRIAAGIVAGIAAFLR